jgi:acetyl esterase/lipase
MKMGGAAARYLAGTLLLGAALAPALATAAPPPSPPPSPPSSGSGSGVQILRSIPYKPGSSSDAHTLDLYLPARDPHRTERPPLLVYIHGGAWISGDRRQYVQLGAGLLAQGVAVAVINYRLSDVGKDPHPAHVQDAAAAVAFVRRSAPRYGYDPERIFVGGHSAGAHISALLAFSPGYLQAVGEKPESVRGFVGIEGIYDLPALVQRFPQYREDFLAMAFGSDERGWEKASPQRLPLRTLRPWLLIHSREDELVDEPQSRRFADALQAAGVKADYALLARGSHFGVLAQLVEPADAAGKQLVRFLLARASEPQAPAATPRR